MNKVQSGLVVGVFSLAMLGCSNPKSAVIPSDPSKWDQLSKSTKNLSEGDRKELASYLMRMSMAGAFGGGGKPIIPPGTTVRDALQAQKNFEADQNAATAN